MLLPLHLPILRCHVTVVLHRWQLESLTVVVDALSSLSVVQPPMKGTHHTVGVFDLSAHSQVRPHVQTVGLQRIHHTILSPEHYQILSSNVYVPDLSLGELFREEHAVPAVGIGRRW